MRTTRRPSRLADHYSDLMALRDSTWVHGRAEWYRKLHRRDPETRDIYELGARAASCLWAEADSPRYTIGERGRGKR